MLVLTDQQVKPNLKKHLEMVNSLQHQFKKFHITCLLQDDNRHAESLVYLTSKIDLEIPWKITVKIRDEPTYTPTLKVNVILDVKKILDVDIKDMWMKPLLDFILKNQLAESTSEAHKIQLKAKRHLIINKKLYHKSAA